MHSVILVNNSRIKSPPLSKRPKADQISGGRGKISEEVYQANNAMMTCTKIINTTVGRPTLVLGLNTRRRSAVKLDMSDVLGFGLSAIFALMAKLRATQNLKSIYLPIMISTRRFFARPAGVSLDTNGLLAP